MTIEQLFGTLQQAIVGSWRKHLRTAKYGKHEALDEFYKEMPEKVDALIEAWMGANGRKIGKFENLLSSANYNTLSYLHELKKICKQGYGILGENDELKSLLDDIVNLINSTTYKVKELSESKMMNLSDFINESLNKSRSISESASTADINKATKLIGRMSNDDDLISVSSCFQWLDDCDWKLMNAKQYAKRVNDINDDVDVEYAQEYYAPVMIAMAKVGKAETVAILKRLGCTDEELEDYGICESDVN